MAESSGNRLKKNNFRKKQHSSREVTKLECCSFFNTIRKIQINIQKAAVIGCGFVGASTAFSLVQKGLFSELVLIDANKEKAEGEAMDLSHGRPFVHSMKIYAGDYDDISDCALIIITGFSTQKCGDLQINYSGDYKTKF